MRIHPVAPAVLLAVGVSSCSGCDDPGVLSATLALCVEPEDVAFGQQPVRAPATRNLVVTNCGNVPIEELTAELVAVDGDEEALAAFQLVATDVVVPLVPGDRFFLPVRFRPKDARPHAAEVVIEAPDLRGGATERVSLSGTGVPLGVCDVLVGPDPVEFGPVLLGDAVERDVTFTNQGTAPCALSGARVTLEHDDFFEVAVPPPDEVAPGASVTTTIRFSPSDVGARTGRLAVVVGGSVEIEVDLTGTGVSRDSCALFSDPSPIALPRASVGFTQTEASAIVASVGELPCTVASTTISQGAGEFTVVTGPAAGTVLEPGQSAPITVAFDPQTPGPREGVLTMTTSEGVALDVPLLAFADPAPTCALRFDPGTVSFAPLAVGLSAEADVTFTNASDVPCTLQGAALSTGSEPDFTLLVAPTPGPLEPGATGAARIRFTAQRAAPSLGRLVLDLGAGVTSSVDLLGFGDYAELVLTPGFVPYGIVTQGCASDTVEFVLTNVGPVAARVDAVAFTAASDPNFELLQTLAPGTMIDPGASAVMPGRMLGAPSPGSHHGNLEVRATGTLDPRERAEVTGQTESAADAARTDRFTQRERPIIDILFVVDNSGSMGEEQNNLALNFGEFIRFTTELDIDYQIGVVTTEGTGTNAGKLRGPIITNSGPNASADPVGDFVTQANVGTNGSADERGLQASVLALTEPLISTTNAGFLRDGALLSIIYVSDEEDHSPGDVGGWLDALLAVKGYDADAVVASAIAGDVPGGCDSSAGDADAATRYLDVVNATQGVFASICAADWATTMEAIGLGTFQALTRFQLSREPDVGTMVVTVDGVAVPESELNGWSYDEDSNSVKFNGTAVPEAGQEIEVSYVAECIQP